MPAGRKATGPDGQRVLYDRISIGLPVTEADMIRNKAKKNGMSVSRYLSNFVRMDIDAPDDRSMQRIIDAANTLKVSTDKLLLAAALQFIDKMDDGGSVDMKYLFTNGAAVAAKEM